MKPTTYTLPAELTDRIDEVARQSERSRSFVVRKLLEQSLTAQDRGDALQAIAQHEVAAANKPRERVPNSSATVAEDSTDGHQRFQSLRKIGRAPTINRRKYEHSGRRSAQRNR